MVQAYKEKNQQKNTLSKKKLWEQLNKYAISHDFMLNPHKGTLSRLLVELLEILEANGYLYCPCRKTDITGDLLKDKKLICPCAYHLRELEENGFCKCELFVKNFGKIPSIISTSIHRAKIEETFTKNGKFSILIHLTDRYKGNVKIYIPDKWLVKELLIEDRPATNYSIDKNILFSPVEFKKLLGNIKIKFEKIE